MYMTLLPFFALSIASSIGSVINFLFLAGDGLLYKTTALDATDAPVETVDRTLDGVRVGVEVVGTMVAWGVSLSTDVSSTLATSAHMEVKSWV